MKLSMRRPSASQLLQRVLEAPDLALQVRALPPPDLAKLVERIGLEDAGELIAFATTEQLEAVFDEDLWRSARAGSDETFDAGRFLVWLEVMLEAGDRFVASRLFELDTELVTLALHKHLLVLDMDALVAEMEGGGDDVDQVEKALSDCLCEELEAYRLIARRHEGWDDLLTAILALDRDHHDYLVKILDRCAAMSSEYIEDNGGLYEVLTSEEMLEGDVAADREDRRAAAGHVAPSAGAAFLKLARRPEATTNERDPLTRAYFRSLSKEPMQSDAAPAKPLPARGAPKRDLLAMVREAETLDRPLLLEGVSENPRTEMLLVRALRELARNSPPAFATRSEELAYLANVLSSGCELLGQRFRPAEAVQAAIATTNLGLELAVAEGGDAKDVLAKTPADLLFRAAWRRLDVEVVRRAAEAAIRGANAESREALRAKARLESKLAAGTPWLAANELDVMLDLAPEDVDAFRGLLGECPTMRGALRPEGATVDGHAFVSTLDDLARIRVHLGGGEATSPAPSNPRRSSRAARSSRPTRAR